MPLNLIYGPPNSGRRGLIRERFAAALGRDPVLVVPTVDDVFGFEQEICGSGQALLGGSVLTFGALFGEVAKAAGEPAGQPLTPAQRIGLLRAAIERTSLGPLSGSARRPGFPRALDELIEELQASALDPAAVQAGASTLEGSAYLGDLAALYGAYSELRDGGGHADSHTVARAALAALRPHPDLWGSRPVLLYGFDDLSVEQLELVRALGEAAEVTVALTYEDRAALSARDRLLRQLRGSGSPSETRTEADPANTASPLLFHLERGFLAEGKERMSVNGALRLLRAAGARGEAELIGAEIARLLHGGTAPAEIAVALRDPARRGPLLARVLRGYRIPVALEADLPVADTASGSCLLALLRAEYTTRSAGDVLGYLRGPRRAAGPGQVDWLERAIRRGRLQSAGEALEAWERDGRELPWPLLRLREAGDDRRKLLAAVADLARDIAQWPLAHDDSRGQLPEREAALELRAGEQLAAAVEELAGLEGLEPGPEELIAALEAVTMPAWSGPVEGRVRIASPYRLRASRFAHVFVGSLQDGEFPRHGTDGPFLSDEQRKALGLAPRQETEAEERYLFHVCLSLPTERLYLSYRSSDEAGGAEARSPFLGEVRRLLDPLPPGEDEADPLEERITRTRGLGDVLFPAADAPSERELARSLAVRSDGEPAAALAGLGVEGERAERVAALLAAAAEAEQATRAPGPLRLDSVKEALASVAAYGGTTLETFDVCSYKWFVGHELDPEPLDPTPEPLAQGLLMHSALEQLYGEAPGEDALPRPGDVERWVARAREIVDELSAELSEHPADRAMRRRVERLIVAFVRREAARVDPQVRPSLMEAAFDDEEEGAAKPALRIGDWALHGRIDRVDEGGGVALVRDYKVSREVTPYAKFVESGTLQLPLYVLALRRLWGLDVAGGLYQPLRPTKDPRPRGLVRSEEKELLEDLGLVSTDILDPDGFEAALTEAEDRAGAAVARMRSGDITRDPGPPEGFKTHNQCPKYCSYAPICRRERAPLFVIEEEEEEEQAA